MAIDLQNPQNIATGWKPPEQFHAPEIGGLVGHILQNRLAQQALTEKNIADAIKQYQTQREDSAYTEALRNAGLTQGQDISGLGSKQATMLAQLIQAQTPDTDVDALHQAMARYYNAGADAGGRGGRGGSGGTPRYDYHGVLLTGDQYMKQLHSDRATAAYGKLSETETNEQVAADAIAKKWGGVDLQGTGGFVNAPGGFLSPSDPQKQAEYQRDLTEYGRHANAAAKAKADRVNYEKLYRGALHPDEVPTAPSDDEDNTPPPVQPPPQTSYTPPPAQPSASPAATPRPNAPPPADSSGGHTATYGTPAPGGGGQTGDLVPGQSKRYVANKWWTWNGNQWQPD